MESLVYTLTTLVVLLLMALWAVSSDKRTIEREYDKLERDRNEWKDTSELNYKRGMKKIEELQKSHNYAMKLRKTLAKYQSFRNDVEDALEELDELE